VGLVRRVLVLPLLLLAAALVIVAFVVLMEVEMVR
jgi:hypothetical protein